MARTQRQVFYEAPSGRVHSVPSCTGGPGPRRLARIRLTRTEFENARIRTDLCRCAKWREESA